MLRNAAGGFLLGLGEMTEGQGLSSSCPDLMLPCGACCLSLAVRFCSWKGGDFLLFCPKKEMNGRETYDVQEIVTKGGKVLGQLPVREVHVPVVPGGSSSLPLTTRRTVVF